MPNGLFSNAIWIPDSPAIWIPEKWMLSCFPCFASKVICCVAYDTWSSIWMAGLEQDITHRPTIWIPNHLKSELQKVGYLFPVFKMSVFKMSVFRSPLYIEVKYTWKIEFAFFHIESKYLAKALRADCAPGPGVLLLLPPVALSLMWRAVMPRVLIFSATS